MSKQHNRMDDPRNNLNIAHKEVKEGNRSSTDKRSNDIIRRNAKLAFEADQKRQEEANREQIATRVNKDTKISDSPSIETEEYKGMRANVLKAAEGRIKEIIAPDSPNVEQQGLSPERQIELSKLVLSGIRPVGDLRRKPLVDTKFESDRSSVVSDNTDVPTYTGKEAIRQIEALEGTGGSFYAYSSKGEIHITSEEKAKAKLGNEAMDSLKELGASYYTNDIPSQRIRRIDLEDAKNGIRVAESKLKLDITALQVEKSQDTRLDAIRPTDGKDAQIEARKEVLDALNRTKIIENGWGDLLDQNGEPKAGTSLYWKESTRETTYFANQQDQSIRLSLDGQARENEATVSVFDAAQKIREGFKATSEGPIYAARNMNLISEHPNDHSTRTEFLITNDEEGYNFMVQEQGYKPLDETWTSMKEFVGAERLEELPVWMRGLNKEDFAEFSPKFEEYQPDLEADDFIKLAQNKPLEHGTVPADAWRDRLKPEEHVDQGEAALKERLSRVERTFAEDEKGKQFNDLKKDLDDLYDRISKRSVPKEVSEQAEDQKGRADMYPIQMDAFFKLKEANPSLNGQYEQYYDTMVKDMNESVASMQKSLDQSRIKPWDQLNQEERQDIPASSKSETKEEDSPARSVAAILRTGRLNFMQRVDFYGNDEERKASLRNYDNLVGDVKAIEERLLKKGISQKAIYEQVEGRVGYYEGRINAAITIGDISREHSLPLEDTTRRIKEDLLEFEAKEDFVSSIEKMAGKGAKPDKYRAFGVIIYDNLKEMDVDKNGIDLALGIMKEKGNKEEIREWIDTSEVNVHTVSDWFTSQIDNRLQHPNPPFAREQLEREMGRWRTGETRA